MDSGWESNNCSEQAAGSRAQPQRLMPGTARGHPGYLPYGYLSISQTLLGFNGDRRDPVTDCYLLGNGRRAFNPRLMRFISSDRMSPFAAGGLNSYAYCLGDPVNRHDPQGNVSIKKLALSLSRRGNHRTAKGPGKVNSYGGSYISETRVHTKIEENFSPAVNKITINQDAKIPAGYELIGYHGSRRPNAEKTLLSGLNSRHGTVMWYGHGFYTSPYVNVASIYAGRDGRIYGVYAKNFSEWVHGKHFKLPNREEMVILESAYKNVIVRREVKFPLVLSDTFEKFMNSPPDENWRLWSSSRM